MSYRAIDLPTSTPPEIVAIVRRRVDLFCADVHAMLRLPLPGLGITAGCNFAAVEVLCALISSVSRVFLDPALGSAQAFRTVLNLYPDEHLPLAVPKVDLIEQLYKTYRCNFSHSLGINVPDPQVGQARAIVPLRQRTKVLRIQPATTSSDILGPLEADAARPLWLPPTVYHEDGVQKLCIESLYWGVRYLVRRVAADAQCAANATAFLRTAFPSQGPDEVYAGIRYIPLAASLTFEVSSSAAAILVTTGAASSSRS